MFKSLKCFSDHVLHLCITEVHDTYNALFMYLLFITYFLCKGAAVVEWLSSWLAEQEVRGLIPSLAT